MHIRVITIPNGKDPDEFIKRTAPRFKLLIDRSSNDIEYQRELGRMHSLDTTDRRVSYLREAAILLSRLNNPLKGMYMRKLSAELSVSKQAILDQISRYQKSDKASKAGAVPCG